MGAKKKSKPRKPVVDLDDDEDDDDDSDVIPVEDDPPGNFLTRLLFRPWVLLILAGAASIWFGGPQLKRLLPDLGRRPEYRASVANIRINTPPEYVPTDLTQDAFEKAGLTGDLSLLDRDIVERIAQAFRAHPWVQDVVSVRKEVPTGIIAELRYRKPVAMVKMEEGFLPIDSTGVLLPVDDFLPEDAKRYPLIENVSSKPGGAPGTSWGDRTIIGAARLAETLAGCWVKLEFVSIYVVEPGSGSTGSEAIYELRTPGGSRVIWGRAPGTDHPGELSSEQKLGRLEKYRADHGRFDQPHGPYEIDIRHWQEMTRRPISAARVRDRR